ncbi:hypothetical protein [Parachitinimonas caeni]|uniref:Chitin-binding type-3 domain-containing protein n=1 Tax=Parachitinimonas caeni TaxID=3031301 RepID=A0ABT7DV10_9NEIS|nr:hypothetical protein [Parachitinimonas caeni]MDK2123900.1 hypothetical protein [Parachitinimonas caeni]
MPAFAGVASTADQQAISEYLQRLNADTKRTMDELPQKKAAAPFAAKTANKFSPQAIQSGAYIATKDEVRNQLINGKRRMAGGVEVFAASAAIAGNDDAARLVDNGSAMVRNVFDMDTQNLKSARLEEQPWSDTYWPLYNGSVSNRYADSSVNNSSDWKALWTAHNQTSPVAGYISGGKTDFLSPAEKYDLLVGDTSFGLTAAGWNSGKGYYDRNGKVEGWMGLCHGWAPAAYMLPRPKNTITVTSANGTKVKLFPSDIKAMGTMLWANSSPSSRFIGGRCNAKDPAKDTNGRIQDQNCFDNNPGTWHQAVVNQIGVSKRSFVLDATYDYEVWNQPVLGYSYTYFNPQTGKAFTTAKEAMIARANYTNDKFAKYRSANGVNVVGVRMTLSYIVETEPSQASVDSPSRDAITNVSYMYDLELDANGNIIGGEWYTNRHPDFLWTPAPTTRAQSYYNPGTPWNVLTSPMPADWTNYAAYSSRYNQPMSAVVERLFNLSAADDWNTATTYKTGARVKFNGALYAATRGTKGETPSAGGAWRAL